MSGNCQGGILRRLQNTFLRRDFLLFVFCGGMGTLTNFLCSLVISSRLNPTAAYLWGYGISLFIAYILNAGLIFHQPLAAAAFGKFVLSYLPNFLILFSFVAVFLNLFHWPKIAVYALAGCLGLPVTFVLVKVFAFGRHKEERKPGRKGSVL